MDPPAGSDPPERPPAPGDRGAPRRVRLLVADPLVAAGLRALLAEAGWAPETSEDPESTGAAEVALVDADDPVATPAAFDEPLPLLALASDEAGAAAALAAGARGVVHRGAEAALLGAALTALAAGLEVRDPALAPFGGDAGPLEPLTPREHEVLALVAEGLSNREVAERLELSEATVKFHLNALLTKFGARSRTELAVRALRAGLVLL